MTKFKYDGEEYTVTPIMVFVRDEDNSPEVARERARKLRQGTWLHELIGRVFRFLVSITLIGT